MISKSIPIGIILQCDQFQTEFPVKHAERYKWGMPIADVLQRLMAARQLNSNSLANAINAFDGSEGGEAVVHQGTIWKVLTGKIKDPGTDVLKPLADFFGVTLPQLRGEVPLDEELAEDRIAYVLEGKYLYPRAYKDVVAGLGLGRFAPDFHVEVDGTVPVPRDLIKARGWRIERLAVVQTKGLSMYPTINDGEPVVVNLDETQLQSSKIYAIEDPGEGLRLKRLYRQNDGRVRVVCDNPDKLAFPDDYITPDSQARIVARAVYRPGEL